MSGLNNNQQKIQQKLIGANEDMFLQAFDSTPKLNIATQKKLENELSRVVAIISNPSADWDNRVTAMKHFRTVVNSGLSETDEFFMTTLKTLEVPFQNNICDLRSQVVRETCITIAFLSCRLQQKFSRMAEILLPSLIKLIPNSAKIVSTSALVALRFIIQSTHNSKLITIIKYQLSTSKSKEIHRALCEIAERIATIWPPATIERHLNDFCEVLRLGICDSDESARQFARRAFNVFSEHFREPADRLFNSLDQQRQRMLNNLNHGGGSTLSINGYGASTNHHNHHQHQQSSIPQLQHAHQIHPAAPPHASNDLVSRLKGSLVSNNGHSNIKASPTPSRIRTPTARSTSAIDVDAQRRARARAVYLSSMYQRPRQTNTISPSPVKPATLASNFSPASNLYHHHHNHPVTPDRFNQHHHQQMLQPQTQLQSQPQPVPQQQQSLTPNVAQQQQKLKQLQQQQASSAEKRDGVALSKAASYLVSVINNNSIAESQIVTTIKYFNSLIEKHPSEIVSPLLSELMPPLVIGIDNAAISVRKASVFAMVAIYAKVGLDKMEPYLTKLTMTQRKLLEVYIKKFNDENKGNNNNLSSNNKQPMGTSDGHDTKGFSSSTISNSSSQYNSLHDVL